MVVFCEDHKCIKTKVDELTVNKRFWHGILNSKWFFWIVTGIVILCLGFVGWTVREIYAQRANEKENKILTETICVQVKEIKQEVKEIKQELKNDQDKRDEQREKDQERLIKILLEIKKEVKK